MDKFIVRHVLDCASCSPRYRDGSCEVSRPVLCSV